MQIRKHSLSAILPRMVRTVHPTRYINHVILLSLLSIITACASGPVGPTANPREMSPIDLNITRDVLLKHSDEEVSSILDMGWSSEDKHQWAIMMRVLLEAHRKIPLEQLRNGVRLFNSPTYSAYFSKIVFAYLSAIAGGEAPYGETELHLLRNYMSHAVHNAGGADDEKLRQARLLCRRLDPDLFEKLFM